MTTPHDEEDDQDALPDALAGLRAANDGATVVEAVDRFLWSIGDNDAGTYRRIVLDALPSLATLLREGSPWTRSAVVEILLDLDGSFVPAPGHEDAADGSPTQPALREAIHAMRVDVAAIAAGETPVTHLAAELVELIDDLAQIHAQRP